MVLTLTGQTVKPANGGTPSLFAVAPPRQAQAPKPAAPFIPPAAPVAAVAPLRQPVPSTRREHYLYPVVLACLSADVPLMLVGPAGSGKSSIALHAARSLELEADSISVNEATSKSELIGYTGATGTYVRTALRDRYERGGLFLIDEVDAGSAGILTVLNGLTSNGVFGFADQKVNKHPAFRVVATANTYGTGADRQYVGRTQLDAATLDRFAVLAIPYDPNLETAIAQVNTPPTPSPAIEPHELDNNERCDWLATVTRTRAAVDRCKLRHVVSPRATIYGLALLAAGIPREMVREMVIFKGASPDTRAKLEG